MGVLGVFGVLDWGVVGLYFALVTTVGLLVGRKNAATSEKDYFTGGRSLPTWAVAVSLVATMLSTVTFVGVPDVAYKSDISYLILNLGVFLAVFVVAFLFIPRLYKAGTITIYGYIAGRYGETARIAVSAAFIVGRLLASGSRLFVAAIPLCYLLFGTKAPSLPQYALAIFLIGAVGAFYTTKGGVRAVVWVDIIQFTIVVGTAILTICILLHRIPLSFSQIIDFLTHSPDPDHPNKLKLLDFSTNPAREFTIWTAFLAVFLNAAAYGVDQDLAQRFMISKSAFKGGISVIASQCIGIVVVSLFLVIGLLLFVFYTSPAVGAPSYGFPKNNGAMYPWFLFHELPTGLAGIAIAGFFAIAQGSLDSAMNAVASSIVADLYIPLRRRRNPGKEFANAKASKWVVASIGSLMCIFAFICAVIFDPEKSTLLTFVLSIMTFALSGMLAVFIAALFTNRGNAASVIAALITGAAIITLFQNIITPYWTPFIFGHAQTIAWPWWMPVATPIAFLICIMGSKRPMAKND